MLTGTSTDLFCITIIYIYIYSIIILLSIILVHGYKIMKEKAN